VNAWRVVLGVGLSTLFFWTPPVLGQVLQLGRWDGSAEVLVNDSRLEIEIGGTTPTMFETENTRTEERLTIRNTRAYVLDPRLITFTLGGTFGLGQERFDAFAQGIGASDERDADLSGYDFFSSIFPGNNTFAANLFANRNKFIQTRELAGRTDVDVENRGVTLFARRLFIPSSLTIRQELNAETSSFGALVSGIDERRDVVRYEGQRGWENKQMILRYELVDKSDEIRPELDFESRDLNLNTSVDFGPDLNRRWDSRIRTLSRDDFSAEDRLDIDQFVHISHSPRLRTQYRYFLTDVERPSGETTSQTASFSLNHLLYESLTTDLQLGALDQSFVEGQRNVYSARLNLRYNKRLPRSGRLIAGLGLSTAKEDDDFEEAFVPQELHTFESPFALPVALDNANVIESSIEVTKIATGPPVVGCAAFPTPIALVEGVDYTLRTVGNRTEIVPLFCSAATPGINPGDTIAVDYRFTRGGEPVVFTSDTFRFDASVDYGWIRPFFIHYQTDEDLVSGTDTGFLTDRQSNRLGVELRYDRPRLRARLQLEGEEFDSDDEVYDALRADADLRYTLKPGIWATLRGRQSARDFSFPGPRSTDVRLLRADLTYARIANLYAVLFASVEDLEDSLVPDQRTAEFGLQARYRLGKLELNGTLSAIDVERGDTDSREYRVMLRVKRRFFGQ